jgi:hypothetical protein
MARTARQLTPATNARPLRDQGRKKRRRFEFRVHGVRPRYSPRNIGHRYRRAEARLPTVQR